MILANLTGFQAASVFFLTMFMWIGTIIGCCLGQTNRELFVLGCFMTTMIVVIASIMQFGGS